MADYFPLVSRAVASLDPNTRERREAIYARAREALDRQLLSLDPPIPAADLARERAAIADCIARVEAQYQAPRPITPPQPKPPVPPPAEPQAPAQPPQTPQPPRLVDPTETEPLVVPQRPKIETGATSRGFRNRRLTMTAIAVGIPLLLLTGVVAYVLRDDPARFNNTQQAAADATQAPPRKSDGRLDGSGGPATAPVTPPRPPQGAPQAPVLPVAARVVFFEETGNDPRGAQSDGQVIWRIDPVPASAGRPADSAVRGTVSVPNAKMTIDLIFKRNRDASLPASHTVEVIFSPEAGREGVKVIGPVEARDQEALPGYPLKGAMVPVATNLFLIGLDNNEGAIQKNLEALRTQKWFAFQFQLESNKLGAVLIEKGPTGDRIFGDAIALWSR